jgi:conjugal transfer/entry exclusion protein
MKMTGGNIYFQSTSNRRTFVDYLSKNMERIKRISEDKKHVAIHIGSLDKLMEQVYNYFISGKRFK